MGFNFPNSPASGDTFSPVGGPTYKFANGVWTQFGTETSFDTRAQAQAALVSPYEQAIYLTGYFSAGDGGGALYKRAVSEPTHAGKLQSADGAWWELAEVNPTPQMFGVVNDDADAIDQTVALQAWLDACTALELAPAVMLQTRAKISAMLTYDPTAGGSPKLVDLRRLNLSAPTSGGLKLGSVNSLCQTVLFYMPRIYRTIPVWEAEGDAALQGDDAGLIMYNFYHCTVMLGHCHGFTIGWCLHSENYGFAYNTFVGGTADSNRYNEVLRTKNGSVDAAGEFTNENKFFGGNRRQNSNTDLLGNAYGTVLTAAAGLTPARTTTSGSRPATRWGLQPARRGGCRCCSTGSGA